VDNVQISEPFWNRRRQVSLADGAEVKGGGIYPSAAAVSRRLHGKAAAAAEFRTLRRSLV